MSIGWANRPTQTTGYSAVAPRSWHLRYQSASPISLLGRKLCSPVQVIVALLIHQLIQKLPRTKARGLVGTALIIFVFRAVPLPGAGATWFEIDQLGFDQQFLSVLSLIAS